MSEMLEWRERLENAHKEMHEAMTELITNKNYSETERRLHYVDHTWAARLSDPVCGPDLSITAHSPSTRRRCFSRISSAMLVRDRRTSSANGAFGRQDRHDSAGQRTQRKSPWQFNKYQGERNAEIEAARRMDLRHLPTAGKHRGWLGRMA